MMAKQRKNPRRRPASFADVDRAALKARDEAITYVTAIFLTVMYDKEGADAETLMRIGTEINSLSDSIAKGYVSVSDLIHTLREEYGIEI
jgi:hypothetical protein